MKTLRNFFTSPPRMERFYMFSVKCFRCGETIRGQVDVRNEPALESTGNEKPIYSCRKVLIGSGRCFQQIEVVIKFDEDRRVIDRKISGGSFIETVS